MRIIFTFQHCININLTLAVLSELKFDNGHAIRFKKKYYRHLDSNGYPVYYNKGTSCIVIQGFHGQLFSCVGKKVYALEETPEHELASRNFDLKVLEIKPKKRYVPPMSHPWKKESFDKFVKKQAHHIQQAS